MAIERQMDKDVHIIYDVILLNHKKEQTSAICSDIGGHRDCRTECDQTEKDKYHMVLHIHAI